MKQRPLLFVGSIYLAGTAVAVFCPLPLWMPLIFLAVTLIAVLFAKGKKALWYAAAGLTVTLAYLGAGLWQREVQRQLQWDGKTVQVSGLVTHEEIRNYGVRYEAKIGLGGETVPIWLYCWDREPVEIGQTFQAQVSLEKENSPYSRGKGIVLRGSAEALVSTGEGTSLEALSLRVRRELIHRLEIQFHGEHQEIMKGILMGERSDLSLEAQDVFNKSGAAHLLVVSGLHVSIFAGGIYAFLRRTKMNQRLAAFLILPVLGAIIFLEGGAVSVIRAVVMGGMLYLARVLRRDYDGLTAWATAALLILVYRPYHVQNAGFLLSFFSVLGILLLLPEMMKAMDHIPQPFNPPPRLQRFLRRCAEAVCASISAMVFTIPVMLYFFGSFPPAAPLSALAVLGLFPALMVLGMGSIALMGIFPNGADLLAKLGDGVCSLVYRLLECISEHIPVIYCQKEYVLLWFGLLYGVIVLLYRQKATRKRAAAVFAGCAVILVLSTIAVLEGEKGDVVLTGCENTLVITKDGHGAVIGTLEDPWDLDELERTLGVNHVERVDLLFLTLPQKNDGQLALDFVRQHGSALVVSPEELDAFRLTSTPYKLGTLVHFWDGWTAQQVKNGAVLVHGKKKFLKIHEKYDIMTTITPEYWAVFGEEHLAAGQRPGHWKKTWSGQLSVRFTEKEIES